MNRRKFLAGAASAIASLSLNRKGVGTQAGPLVSAGLPAPSWKGTRIKVIGMGGCGLGAIKRIFGEDGSCYGSELIALHTNAWMLENRATAHRNVLLGSKSLQGCGTGGDPVRGRIAAEESMDEIRPLLDGADIVVVIAGMGGGTGTGAAPIVASMAKRMGILTIGVVTEPFHDEGPKRARKARNGVGRMSDHTDTLFIVPNELVGNLLGYSSFRSMVRPPDSVLIAPVYSICATLNLPGLVNRNLQEMRNALRGMGHGRIAIGEARNGNRGLSAARIAFPGSPLGRKLIKYSKAILVCFTAEQFSLHEIKKALDYIRAQAGGDIPLIWSAIHCRDKDLLRITILGIGIPPCSDLLI